MDHRALIPHNQPPLVSHPPEAAFHLPAAAIVGPCADRPPTLGPLPGPPNTGGNGGLDAPAAQAATELLAVIGFIRHQLLGACPWAAGRCPHAPRSADLDRRRRPATTITFEPLPTVVLPMPVPFVRRDETAAQPWDERFDDGPLLKCKADRLNFEITCNMLILMMLFPKGVVVGNRVCVNRSHY